MSGRGRKNAFSTPPRRRRSGLPLPAVVLVGGEGMRLRPLTNTLPKPMLPLLDRPLLAYTFDHLRTAGVERIVLACGYLPTAIEEHFGRRVDGIDLDYRVEPEPLGTGGALRFAAAGVDRTFLALNGDSLRDADLARLLAFHRDRRARATILLTRVSDPSRYGLVRTDDRGRVLGFVEKPPPDQIDTDLINAGLYVLEPDVLDLVPPGRAVSIEREVFPQLAEEGSLYALALPGYWLDVGTPASYLQAHLDLLERDGRIVVDASAEISADAILLPPVIVGPNVLIEARSRIGPFVHLGRGARVGREVALRWATVLPGSELPSQSLIARAIVHPELGALTP
jgi:NDP-sugar pyrophosphorylase family protein